MKEIFKMGLSTFGKLVVVGFMCFIIAISFTVLITSLFTEDIGYIAYGTTEGEEEKKELYTYYYSDGEDTQMKEYEAKGYSVNTASIRSEITKSGNITFLTLTQIFSFCILIAFVYPKIWDKGTKDSNLVHFKHQNADIFKGLKVGLISVTPSILFVIVLAITSKSLGKVFGTAIFSFLNAYNYSLIKVICGECMYMSELSAVQYILLILIQLIVPLIAFTAYFLGYKNISISEKLIYKKNKAK